MAAGRTKRAKGKAPETAPHDRATDLVRGESLPWFPFLFEGIHLKLLRVSPATGEMVLFIRVDPGAALGTHYHHGVVVAYTVSGRWRYRDADWVAGPGDAIIGPAGSSHTIEAVGDAPVVAFVHLRGALEFRDDAGRTICVESAETLQGRYLAHCALHGLSPVDVTGI